jgi:hypothetical protein
MSDEYTWDDFDRWKNKYKKEEPGMEPQEKTKITEAMKLCESKIQSFFSYLDDSMDKKYSGPFKDFILANTFFAGGVFRSVLSGTPVNDIDIFFKSHDNIIQFKHLVMSAPIKIFKEVTPNGSYNFKPGKGPKISFTTKNYGDPEKVLQRFDLTFNMHFYDMQRMEMKFDRDTFNKVGVLNQSCSDKSGSVARALRFMNQGFKVDSATIIEVIKRLCDKETPFTLGSSGQAPTDKLSLIKKAYTEKDYFGRVNPDKPDDKLMKYARAQLSNTTSGIPVWATVDPMRAEPEPMAEGAAILFDEPEEDMSEEIDADF